MWPDSRLQRLQPSFGYRRRQRPRAQLGVEQQRERDQERKDDIADHRIRADLGNHRGERGIERQRHSEYNHQHGDRSAAIGHSFEPWRDQIERQYLQQQLRLDDRHHVEPDTRQRAPLGFAYQRFDENQRVDREQYSEDRAQVAQLRKRERDVVLIYTGTH